MDIITITADDLTLAIIIANNTLAQYQAIM